MESADSLPLQEFKSPMETRAGYMMVGAFVLASLLGIIGFFLWLAKKDIDYNVNYYTTYFPGSVTGLSLGGAVHFLGVPVGTVKAIKLHPTNLNVVDVTIAIKNDIPIKEDAYASLELQGLTGYKFVQIYGGSEDSPLLKIQPGQRYPVIPARYSGVDEIMTLLPRLMGKFTNLIDRINVTFNEQNRERFSNTLKNVDILSQTLAETSGPLKDLIKNTNEGVQLVKDEFKVTLRKIDTVAEDISSYFERNKVALDSLTQNGSYGFLRTLNEMNGMLRTATRFFKKLDATPRALLFETDREGILLSE